MTENKADPLREALLKIRQIANGGGHPRLIIAKIYDIATRASRLDASVVVADMKQCPSVNAYVEDYEYRGDQYYKPNEHEQAMIEDAIEGYIAEHALAAPQPAAPSEGHAPFLFSYKNHRGEISMRTASPIGVRFGSTEWHQKPQWLMRAFDHDKDAEREFAMADMSQPAAPLGGREAIDTALRAYFQSRFAPVQLSSDGVDRVYCNGFPLNGLIDAILAAIPQERGVDRAAIELLDRIRAKAQSRVEYWKKISPRNFDGSHMHMLIGQFQTIANDIAAVAAELPLVTGTDRAAIIIETLQHAEARFWCLSDEFEKSCDTASWAMCCVDADRMGKAINALAGKETGR